MEEEATASNTKINFNDLRIRHEKKEQKLQRIVAERNAKLISIYEHTFDSLMKKGKELYDHNSSVIRGVRRALASRNTNIRDALIGGRVEGLVLGMEAGKGRIMYKDFVSLYPAIQVHKEFPGSHPVFFTCF